LQTTIIRAVRVDVNANVLSFPEGAIPSLNGYHPLNSRVHGTRGVGV
jgi:hypothetical protein